MGVRQPSRCSCVRRLGAVDFRAWKLLLRRSNEAPGASAQRRQWAAVRRSLERLRCAASSRRLRVHSGWTWRLTFQKIRRGLSRTNPVALQWSDSSGLLSLLVVRIAINVQPIFTTDSNQGPQRAGTAVLVLNCFLLRPTDFLYMRPQGEGGYTVRGMTGESGLFVNALRGVDFRAFLVAIALLLGFRATQGIVQFSDRTFHPRRRPRIAEANGLRRGGRKPKREPFPLPVLNDSMRVELFNAGS